MGQSKHLTDVRTFAIGRSDTRHWIAPGVEIHVLPHSHYGWPWGKAHDSLHIAGSGSDPRINVLHHGLIRVRDGIRTRCNAATVRLGRFEIGRELAFCGSDTDHPVEPLRSFVSLDVPIL